MASNARKAFDDNLKDIGALVDVFEAVEHLNQEDPADPVPEEYDVVLRSAIVLLVTYWEAYIEDIVTEAVDHLVAHVKSPDDLPKELRKKLATKLKQDKHDLAVWKLAQEGWRKELKVLLDETKKSRNRNFMSPKKNPTVEFIAIALGISDISKAWVIDGKTSTQVGDYLDKIVEIRGKIAHRGKLAKRLNAATILQLKEFFQKLTGKTGGAINSHLKTHTGKCLW